MNFEECLYSRRTVRKYEDRNISEEELNEILKAGMYAPSACNFQAWKFIVIDDQSKKELLENPIINGAPICVMVVYRNDLYVSGREHFDYIQSASAAIENILLCAHNRGVGCCWICHYPDEEKVRKAFHIPDNFAVVGCIAMGYPLIGEENSKQNMEYHYGNEKDFLQHKRRFTPEQVICRNQFAHIENDCCDAKYPDKNMWDKRRKNEKRHEFKEAVKKLLKRS
ncbi:MAG: nitroreductase family protein [Eubacteriales bacterium]|nr:nitroreductase family protein [Eubacteriales bacterium]